MEKKHSKRQTEQLSSKKTTAQVYMVCVFFICVCVSVFFFFCWCVKRNLMKSLDFVRFPKQIRSGGKTNPNGFYTFNRKLVEILKTKHKN